jgi:hypothetical protein
MRRPARQLMRWPVGRLFDVVASRFRPGRRVRFMIEQLFVRVSSLVVIRALRWPGEDANP